MGAYIISLEVATFVIISTGYGKMLCYVLFPYVFDYLLKLAPGSSMRFAML